MGIKVNLEQLEEQATSTKAAVNDIKTQLDSLNSQLDNFNSENMS